MASSKDVLRLMESSLSLKKGSLEKESSFSPEIEADIVDIVEGQWQTSWSEGGKQVKLSSFLNNKTGRYGLILEVRDRSSQPKTLIYHRDFLSSDDVRQEVTDLRTSAVRGKGLRSIGYWGPKWR